MTRRTLTPDEIDPMQTLLDTSYQLDVQGEVFQAFYTASRVSTPNLEAPRTPPRTNRNLDEINGESLIVIGVCTLIAKEVEPDPDVFAVFYGVSGEGGAPFRDSTPSPGEPGSPTPLETPRRSKRIASTTFCNGYRIPKTPKTPARGGLIGTY
jgi:hypothetical protein